MGREKKTTLAAATASKTAKDRHQRTGRDNNAWTAPVRTDLVALPEKNITSKHKSYFQVFENHDKKEKKLELQVHGMIAIPLPWTSSSFDADYN